jgi:hypothetical protein
MSDTISIKLGFSMSDMDMVLFEKELKKQNIPMDMVFDLEDGEVTEFKEDILDKLSDLRVKAYCFYTPARMYDRNGDPGWPEESGIEDIDIEAITLFDKKIDINDLINEKGIERLEVAIMDKFCEADCDGPEPDYDYEGD